MSVVILPTYALIDPPTDEVVTLAEIKAHVRAVDFTDDDDWLTAAVKVFTSRIDARHGWLGRALRPQTWEYRIHEFPPCGYSRGGIELPFPPFIDLVSLKYDNAAGVEQTLVKDTDFKIFGEGSDQKVILRPMPNGSWPTARCEPESIRIQFECGYEGAGDDDDKLPHEVRMWILTNVATAYENRESVVVGRSEGMTSIPSISDDLLWSLRVSWVA